MKLKYLKAATVALAMSAAALTVNSARADSGDALLNKLVEKGYLNQREANQIREQMGQESKDTVETYNKFKMPSWVNDMQLYGDARLRFEWRAGRGQAAGADTMDTDRFRTRLRFGFQGNYQENFFYGLRLETATSNRSTNITLGTTGPSSKGGNYGINVGRLYLGWKPNDKVTLVAGRQEIPFMTTSMVWDDDLNPEGLAEKFIFKTDKVDWFANLGQFIYTDNTENPFGGTSSRDVFMFGWQAGAKLKINKDVSLTVAPTLYHYANEHKFNTTLFTGKGGAANTGIDDLTVFDVPVEFGFKFMGQPAKVFGDFATNMNASDRARAAADTTHSDEKYAYQFGASLGNAKKKGDWLLKAFWQHTELYSLDPNLVDSDLFDSRVNMEGLVVQASYYLTDFLFLKATYGHAHDIDGKLPTISGAGDLGSNLHKYDLLQVDLNWKF